MIGGLSISHSGLRHAQRRLEASAHNTANLTTAKTTASTTAQRPAPFVDEAVEQISIVHQAGALRRAVQTQDDMLGILMDLTA